MFVDFVFGDPLLGFDLIYYQNGHCLNLASTFICVHRFSRPDEGVIQVYSYKYRIYSLLAMSKASVKADSANKTRIKRDGIVSMT